MSLEPDIGPNPLVVMSGVNKHFGDLHVLRDVDLNLYSGEVVVVIGPSGSGKSTLCRTINQLESIDSGQILFEGEPIPTEAKGLSRYRCEVAMVFQGFNLFNDLSIIDNVTLGPIKVKKTPRDQARAKGLELLDRVGVRDQADKMPAELSGGQRQRVAIARALAMDPKLILFDEPTSALDPEMVNEVLDVLMELAEQGTTMLVVTHEMAFARKAADRLVFMADGQIIEQSAPEEFFANPQTDRAKEFLSKVLHS